MSTLATIGIDLIDPHPDNVRRDATADAELFASVKEQGILQPLGLITAGRRYQLIAGHRRLNAARKAGLNEVPAILLHHLDTRVKQIEAMLVENGRRTDLTAVEEAAAYEQLSLEGVTVQEISKATGRSQATVRSRLKLSALPAAATEALHGHQLTLTTAEHLVKLDGYPKLVAEAEDLLAKNQLTEHQARRLVDRIEDIKEHAALRAKYEKSKLPICPDDRPRYGWYDSRTWRQVHTLKDADAYHPGDDEGTYGSAPVLLKRIGVPTEETPEEAAARKAKVKAERAKQKAADDAVELAELMRLEHVVSLGIGLRLDDALIAHLRSAVGKLINGYGPALIERITKAAGVGDIVKREKNDYEGKALAAAVLELKDTQVLSLLLACLAETAKAADSTYYVGRDDRATRVAQAYWAAFDTSGYDLPKLEAKRAKQVAAYKVGVDK